jgi:hypothetical protein
MTPSILPKLWQMAQGQQSQGIGVAITKLVEGYPKCLTQVKQFKGNATKY